MRHLFFVCLVAIVQVAQAQTAFPIYNTPGPHAVGFRVVQQYDQTRSYPAPDPKSPQSTAARTARPIQTAIWYPAVRGKTPLSYDDYLQLLGWDDDFDRPPAEQAKVIANWLKLVANGTRDAQIAAERRSLLWANRDAPLMPGKFPVIVYSPSISSNAFENTEMMEFLASHGYVVLTSPALGMRSRGQRADIEHLEAQAADIRFLVDYATTMPEADPLRIAAMGYSWGGFAIVLAAAKDSRIRALVSLDGTIRYRHKMVEQLDYVKPEEMRIPMLYVAQRPAPFERQLDFKPDLSGSFLRKMKNADVYLLTMYAMEHSHFATSYLRLDPLEFNEYSLEEVAQGHGQVGRYVLNFLNGTMKGERSGLEYLMQKPEKTGAPAHSAYSQFFPAQKTK